MRMLLTALTIPLLLSAGPMHAQDQPGGAAAQANNPLLGVTAFNIQNYYVGEFTTPGDQSGFQTILRFAQPFKIGNTDWLFRASLPVKDFPTPPSGNEFGIGDADAFAAYLIDTGIPSLTFGIGPQMTFPTATTDFLGSEKWSAGLTNVAFNVFSEKLQAGYLLTYQHSFASVDDSRPDFNAGAFQPFLFYQLGEGWYARSAPIWTYNFGNGDYSVPVGLGLGKVVKLGDTVVNLFVEPQYSVFDEGPGFPEWQIFFSANFQFY